MASYAVTFDSTNWTFDANSTITFDINGVNAVTETTDTSQSISNELINQQDTAAQVSNWFQSLADVKNTVLTAVTLSTDTSQPVSNNITVLTDTKTIAWILLPEGVALTFNLDGTWVYFTNYTTSDSGSLELYQAQEVSTGGDKFGYDVLNSDAVQSLSFELSDKNSLQSFFASIADGMANEFLVLDSLEYSVASVRFAQTSLSFSEQDGLFYITLSLMEA